MCPVSIISKEIQNCNIKCLILCFLSLNIFVVILLWLKFSRLYPICPQLYFHSPVSLLTSFCSRLSSSLRLLLTFISCCTLASEEAKAFFTSRYSCRVMGPSDKSDESILWIDRTYKQVKTSDTCEAIPGTNIDLLFSFTLVCKTR